MKHEKDKGFVMFYNTRKVVKRKSTKAPVIRPLFPLKVVKVVENLMKNLVIEFQGN